VACEPDGDISNDLSSIRVGDAMERYLPRGSCRSIGLKLSVYHIGHSVVVHLGEGGQGVPLAIRLTGANRNDSQEALALVDAIPPLQGERGRPRRRPACVLGDRGYDAAAIRHGLRIRHILPLLAMRRTKHGSGLGRWRWVVERTFAWLNQFRRLRVRYDKRADMHEAFLSLGCVWICWQSLRRG
jgi:transposase